VWFVQPRFAYRHDLLVGEAWDPAALASGKA
jgi:hypothetical protein